MYHCPRCKTRVPDEEVRRFSLLPRGRRGGACPSCGVQLMHHAGWDAVGRALTLPILGVMGLTWFGKMPSYTFGVLVILLLGLINFLGIVFGSLIVPWEPTDRA